LVNILLLSPEVDARNEDRELLRDASGVDSTYATKICNGDRKVPRRILKLYSAPDALEYVKLCFSIDIEPHIQDSARDAFLQEILDLVQNDEGLPTKTKEYFAHCANEESLGDFLTEVYLCAIGPKPERRGKSLPEPEPPSSNASPASPQTLPPPVTPAPNWGDSMKGRPFYTLEEIDAGALEGIYAFNSIRNSTIGDEKNFVGARENTGVNAGKNNVWCIDEIKVQHSAEYIVRLYVHGSNNYGTDSIASNVKVAFNIPTETAKCVKVTGFIFANHAHPNQYWSSVAFVSDIPFRLEYIYGSALLENNGVGKNGGVKLSDEIVTKAAANHGTFIGHNQLDGRVPTGYQYANYITIRVKAVFDVPFLIEGKVRIDGSVDWAQSVKVRTGTILDFQFYYKNINGSTQNDVMLQCKLPSNLHYVTGSTKIFNAKYDDGALSEGITTKGVNIGNYTPSSDAYVRFTVEVVDDNLADGWNTLITWIKCSANQIVRQESINIRVKK